MSFLPFWLCLPYNADYSVYITTILSVPDSEYAYTFDAFAFTDVSPNSIMSDMLAFSIVGDEPVVLTLYTAADELTA